MSKPVSYTHLDVYKRQSRGSVKSVVWKIENVYAIVLTKQAHNEFMKDQKTCFT